MATFKKIDTAIDVLSDKITTAINSDNALKYTQAALNMAHVKSQLEAVEEARANKGRTKGTG